jgi:hypothetical protein
MAGFGGKIELRAGLAVLAASPAVAEISSGTLDIETGTLRLLPGLVWRFAESRSLENPKHRPQKDGER